jgi:antitoxin component of MazEF toxin-antitoxin module
LHKRHSGLRLPSIPGQVQIMTPLKLHYDGWISLPASLCQALGLSSGDRLEIELVDGALALRPLAKSKGRIEPVEETASSFAMPLREEELALASDAVPAKRKPGRPRKNSPREAVSLPVPRTARGRPRKAAAMPEPEPTAGPSVTKEPWILRKKADLLPAAPVMEKLSPLERRPEWPARDDASFVEPRPFRRVEVRKLGPGRRHNRPQQVPARQRGQGS